MTYYFVEEESPAVLHMVRACTKFFPVPTTVDCDELKLKLQYLDELLAMWTDGGTRDSSYHSDVYRRICEMFSENVFRRYEPRTVGPEDEIGAETMWEFRQLFPVYGVFSAFLELDGFDGEKLATYAGGPFAEALVWRLRESPAEAERICAKRILFRLLDRVPSLGAHLLKSTVDALLAAHDRAQTAAAGGVNELLELFDELMRRKLAVDTSVIAEVLSGMIVGNGLCHYAEQLHKCIETAGREVDAKLPAWFVEYAVGHWPATAAHAPTLCRTLAVLFFDACGPQCRRRVRDRVVTLVIGRLLAAAASADVDSAEFTAACREYVGFCGRLIDDVSVAARERNDFDDGGRSSAEHLAGALVAVYLAHRDYDCVNEAGRLLRRLIGKDGRGRRLVSDACRVTVLEALVEDRPWAMTEDLVDNAF